MKPDSLSSIMYHRSPTMGGDIFVIDRKFFESIGKYDSKVETWEVEHLEVSFRVS